MRHIHAARIRALLLVLLASALAGCGYNTIPTLRAQAEAAGRHQLSAALQDRAEEAADCARSLRPS